MPVDGGWWKKGKPLRDARDGLVRCCASFMPMGRMFCCERRECPPGKAREKNGEGGGQRLRATAGRPRAPAAGARERRAALRLCARAALVRCANM
ncbi:hypothetical protein J6352_06395 [Burkholderia pseudomallei]|uniref:hypothetical protein n=1 Tax=Burkholderia pseudomallei TaxID=28450 RepID=UPI001AD727CF|nr:hypothetical protein [Burkholderia pseudomallei]MBO7772002.1 hypothetical protein [Burkholderia pseudomallei]MBO7905016.1 hypothetical protein [Burkholderia pseudomallei]